MDQSLLCKQHPPRDSTWFAELAPLADELYITLGIPHQQLSELRHRFEQAMFVPDLRPLHLDSAVYQQRNKVLAALAARISREESDAAVLAAYKLKIEELTVQNQLVLAAIAGDADALAQANRWLYGSPDARLVGAVCDWLRQLAIKSYPSSVPHLSQAAAAVLEHVPDFGGSQQAIVPNSHVFKQVREAHFRPGGYMEQLFGTAQLPDNLTPLTGDPVTSAAIVSVGSSYRLQASTDHLWGVIHAQKAVVRPEGYSLDRAEFLGIVAHEVGSHLLERENGLRQPLRLLSTGLDRYEASNEGRAFLREQIMFQSPYDMLGQKSWEHVVLLYLSAAIGTGIANMPNNFVDMYKLMLVVCTFLENLHAPDNPVMAGQLARESAWNISTRAAKGTDGNGGAFAKGLVYLAGNTAAWEMAAEIGPGAIFYGDSGKFDITRHDHRQILEQCGINLGDYRAQP